MRRWTGLVLLISLWIGVAATASGQSAEVGEAYRLLFRGQIDSLIALLEPRVSRDTTYGDPETLSLLGLAYARRLDFARAVSYLERAAELRPGDAWVQLSLAEVYERWGRLDLAEHVLEGLSSRDSILSDVLPRLGRLLFREGKTSRALRLFRQLCGLHPDRAAYFVWAARCAVRLDSLDLASDLYRRSVSLDSANVEAWLGLAQVALKLDSARTALWATKRGLEVVRRQPRLHRLRAEALRQLGLLEAAVLEFLEAQALGDSSAELFHKLGSCYFSLGKLSKAKAAFLRAFERKPDNATSAYGLGLCYKGLDSLTVAAAWFRTALELSLPEYLGDVYLQLGDCLTRSGQFEEGIRVLREALDHARNPGPVYYALATAYDKYYRDRKPALQAFERALRYGGLSEEAEAYARARLAGLREALHFQRGRQSSRRTSRER